MRIAVTATGATLESPLDPRFGRCPYFLLVETDDLQFEAVANPNVSRDSGAGIQAAQLVADKGVRFVVTGNCGPNAYQTLSAAGVGVIVGCSGTVRDVVEQFKADRYMAAGQPNVASHFGVGAAVDSAADSYVSPSAKSGFVPAASQGPGRAGGGLGAAQEMGRGGGMGRGMARGGGGMGMGRGMGRGGGGGMGTGRGMGRGAGLGQGGGRGMGPEMRTGGGLGSSIPDLQPQPIPPSPSDSNPELAALKAQAQEVQEQLAALQQRISQIGQDPNVVRLIAVVDAGQCMGCGLCVEVCPAGAITVQGAAQIDVARCTGCGQCVADCPQAAISLRRA